MWLTTIKLLVFTIKIKIKMKMQEKTSRARKTYIQMKMKKVDMIKGDIHLHSVLCTALVCF